MANTVATTTSNNKMVAIVKQSLLEITSARKHLSGDRLLYALGYYIVLSGSQPFTPEDRIFKAEETEKIKKAIARCLAS